MDVYCEFLLASYLCGLRLVDGRLFQSLLTTIKHFLLIWYTVPQEERSIFRETTISVILNKQLYMYTCAHKLLKLIQNNYKSLSKMANLIFGGAFEGLLHSEQRCSEGLRKIIEDRSRNNRCPGLDSKPVTSKYKCKVGNISSRLNS